MTRIGLHGETDKIYGELKEISKLENIALEGIFTHYAVADSLREQDEEYTKAQTEKILAVADKCEAEGLHLEKVHFLNSAGGVYYYNERSSLARLGIILYGLYPDPAKALPFEPKPAMEFKAAVAQVKYIDNGTDVSYGRTYTANGKVKLATVTAGYADGYPRALSNKGYVLINGPEHWNTKKQEAYISVRLTELDNQNNEIANKKIKALRDSVSSYKEYLCDNPDKITNSLNILREYIYKDYKHINRISKMKQQISATLEMKQLIDRQSTKESTKKGNIGAIGYLETFLKASKIDNTWNNINLETLEQFKQYYINKKTNATTINAYIKRILAVCRIANKSSKIQFSFEGNNLHLLELIKDNTNKTKRKNKQVALTEEQVMSLYSYTPKGRKATELEEIRDIFILQCLVGQRISDMPKFFNGDYKYDSKTNTITITQQKTNEMAIIPLLPLAREILNKYNNKKMIVDINTIKDFRMNKDIKRSYHG